MFPSTPAEQLEIQYSILQNAQYTYLSPRNGSKAPTYVHYKYSGQNMPHVDLPSASASASAIPIQMVWQVTMKKSYTKERCLAVLRCYFFILMASYLALSISSTAASR